MIESIYERTNTQNIWLITGVAGFIGSNLLEALLKLNQRVIGLDNFSTSTKANLEDVKTAVGNSLWSNFEFMEGDIRDLLVCKEACKGVDFVLHQAALGSVPRSILNPVCTNDSNVNGFVNVLEAARVSGVKRFVYASSSSVYGDNRELPKVEERLGKPISPYAVSKLVNEVYGNVFSHTYGIEAIGLRYFNVFGRRQSIDGPYAAVIPKWISALFQSEPVSINGDGNISRDFCYIENVVQANLKAALTQAPGLRGGVYNIAVGEQTTLNDLFSILQLEVSKYFPQASAAKPVYKEQRAGDIVASLADISKAKRELRYVPMYNVKQGLNDTVAWYAKRYV